MNAETARHELLERCKDLSEDRFVSLCQTLVERVADLDDVDISNDPDKPAIIGRFGIDPLEAAFGVRARQFSRDVRPYSIEQFQYLLEQNNLDLGAFVTTASFSDDAIISAEQQSVPLRLVDGDDFATLLLINEIGVTKENGGYRFDDSFWRDFGKEPITSSQIPQANDIETLSLVVQGIAEGYHFKPEIRYYLEQETNQSWNPRQAGYYANAATMVGLVTKELDHYQGRRMDRYDLELPGQEYVQALENNSNRADEILAERLQSVDVVARLIKRIEDAGTIKEEELKEFYYDQITLDPASTTTDRRFATLRHWLDAVDVITVQEHDDGYIYRHTATSTTLSDYE